MRCLSVTSRTERGAVEFLANPGWLIRVLSVVEEWQEEEVLVHALRIARNCFKNESTYDRVTASMPNIGNFLLATLAKYDDNFLIATECFGAFRNISRKPQY